MGTRLRNKTALVTGATSNIGRAIAIRFAAEGAQVVVSGRNHQRGAEVVDEIRAEGGRADFVAAQLDGSAKASKGLAAEATRVLGGRTDVLVNSAGIPPGPSTVATDEATFDEVYGVNVKAPFFLTAAIAPAMAERGSGAIINLGSWIARLGIPVGALYSSTKGAIETLMRAWAAEFGPVGVRVNAISPGVIRRRCLPRQRRGGVRPRDGARRRWRPCGRGCHRCRVRRPAVGASTRKRVEGYDGPPRCDEVKVEDQGAWPLSGPPLRSLRTCVRLGLGRSGQTRQSARCSRGGLVAGGGRAGRGRARTAGPLRRRPRSLPRAWAWGQRLR